MPLSLSVSTQPPPRVTLKSQQIYGIDIGVNNVKKAAIREDLRAGGTLRKEFHVELTEDGVGVDIRA